MTCGIAFYSEENSDADDPRHGGVLDVRMQQQTTCLSLDGSRLRALAHDVHSSTALGPANKFVDDWLIGGSGEAHFPAVSAYGFAIIC